jgi:hypothetical protein
MAPVSLPGMRGGNNPAVQGLLLRLLVIVLLPALLGAEDRGLTPFASPRPGDYRLTVHGQLITLWAQDASLKAILHAIGREMAIDVEARISANEKRTVAFDKLSLIEALKRLHANYAQLVETKQGEHTITKIIVLPQGEDTAFSKPVKSASDEAPGRTSPRPAPFRFEFDPTQHEQKPR